MEYLDTLDVLNRLNTLGNVEEEDDSELNEDKDRHDSLLSALGVDKTQDSSKSRNAMRSEATNDVSVFSLNPGSKVKVRDLLSSVKGTISINALKKNISKIQDPKNQLSALLPKIAADRVERDAAYEESSNKISKWDDVVDRNRKSEHLSFPLKHENMHIHTVDEFVQKFKPKTPLEEQIYSLLKGSKFKENPETGLSQAEEEVLRSVSLEEAKRRRAELQRHRVLLSYHEAKNRRLSKIKSKRHMRIVRKQKQKKSAAEFEKLQKTDPEKAEEKLKHAQKTRAEERAVLRHRQGSKWAKNRMLIARYNEMTKVHLQEQRKLHGELVQKNLMKIEDSDEEDEEETAENSELNPLVSPTASLPEFYLPKDNPWLKQKSKPKSGSANEDVQESVPECLYSRNSNAILGLGEVAKERDADSNEESVDGEDDLKLELSELKDKKRIRDLMESGDAEPKENVIQEESIQNFRAALADLRKEKRKVKEDKVESSIEKTADSSEDEGLEIGLERRKTLEDLENVLESENQVASLKDLTKTTSIKTDKKKIDTPKKLELVDPSKVFSVESTDLTTEVIDMDDDAENGNANRMTIQEAFADDDVVADFVADKKRLIDNSKPKVQDLSLPGWGEWAGSDIKSSKRKRRRFRIKPPPAPPRKDSHLGAVVINENRDSHIAKHQVRQLPYGYKSYEQYERSIRQPIGKTWNTPATFKSLTKPKVSTVMGAIIDPMDEADAFDSVKAGSRKRAMQEDGHIRFDDVEPAEQRHFKRKKGNKKHKK